MKIKMFEVCGECEISGNYNNYSIAFFESLDSANKFVAIAEKLFAIPNMMGEKPLEFFCDVDYLDSDTLTITEQEVDLKTLRDDDENIILTDDEFAHYVKAILESLDNYSKTIQFIWNEQKVF